MKSILATVIALGLAVSRVFAQSGPTVVTPTPGPTACETALLQWTNNGKGPFILNILSADLSTTLYTFPASNATSVSWFVDIAANTRIVLRIVDVTGAMGESAPFLIQPNTLNTTSCVGSTSFSFQGTDAPGATTQGPAAATTTAPSTGNTATTNAGSSAAAPSGSSGGSTATATRSSSTTTPSSGAYRVTGQIATAGLIGAAMVALLV